MRVKALSASKKRYFQKIFFKFKIGTDPRLGNGNMQFAKLCQILTLGLSCKRYTITKHITQI